MVQTTTSIFVKKSLLFDFVLLFPLHTLQKPFVLPDMVEHLDSRLADNQKSKLFSRSYAKEAFNFPLPQAQSHSSCELPRNFSFSAYCFTMSLKRTSHLLLHFTVARSHLRAAFLFECLTKSHIRCLLTLRLYFVHRIHLENFLVWNDLTQSP